MLTTPNSEVPLNNVAPAVEFRDVSVRFGDVDVLSGLNLVVRQGDLFVLLGRSGTGKSTVLKLVNRLVEPASGVVSVHGSPVMSLPAETLRRRTGYVIQENALFPHLTVRRNIEIVPRLAGWEPEARSTRVVEMLSLTGLDVTTLDRYPGELSGGQRQRVGVARALAADPELLLCDEPFGALDPITRRAMQKEFTQLSRRIGKTMLFVTHDVDEALLLGTRIGVLASGRLVFDGSPEEFLRSTKPLVRDMRSESS